MTEAAAGSRPAVILLVEDNEGDVELTREAFRRAQLALDMYHVENGELCMQFLRREGEYADMPEPDLVLLDLNLPVMDGREVLAEMVADERLQHIPVVVLTTADEHAEIVKLYKMRVSSYIKKPVDFEQFLRVIRDLGHYWFTVVVLPNGSRR